MKKKKMVLLTFSEAKRILTKKELKNWSLITNDFSKKKNKSLVLIPVNNKGRLISTQMVGSNYPNHKSMKKFKNVILNDKRILKGYKIF
ncbi:MAG TPA: hypothetical protein EYG89_06530 [Bacteroidia bacterium]|nr:hypothetical protein [Bacteroidia bacterium]